MCRLFAFRSVIPSQVHRSLIGAENALLHQSTVHPDGWGVAYYQGGCPHVIKSTESAIDDRLFQRVSGIVASETVVAHLRRATTGELSILNTHPFQFGRWVFAHNGNLKGFAAHADELRSHIAPGLRRFLLGQTDSETLFFIILTRLAAHADIHDRAVPTNTLITAVHESLDLICKTIPIHGQLDGPPDETYLSFVLTNGESLLAHHGGQSLHLSTHKSRCSVRDTCPHLESSCENPVPRKSGTRVNHLIISSEPLRGENIWSSLDYGDIVAAAQDMTLTWSHFPYSQHLQRDESPLVDRSTVR
jgi:glutamine amidotransferase